MGPLTHFFFQIIKHINEREVAKERDKEKSKNMRKKEKQRKCKWYDTYTTLYVHGIWNLKQSGHC